MAKWVIIGAGALLVIAGLRGEQQTDQPEIIRLQRVLAIATGAVGVLYGIWILLRG